MNPVEKRTKDLVLMQIMYINSRILIPIINLSGDVENFANHCENMIFIKCGDSSIFSGASGSIMLFRPVILSFVRLPL
jgi:hypothetical protein